MSFLSRSLPLLMMAVLIAPSVSYAQPEDKERSKLTELEKTFYDLMKDSVLIGSFRLITKDGALTEPRDEVYTVDGAQKIHGENWTVKSRIQYGKVDVTVPIPIKLYWVEDTPVISVTDLMVPGVGVYTSRVQVYRGVYAGSWFGKGYGGTLSGRIMKRADYEKQQQAKENESKKKVDGEGY